MRRSDELANDLGGIINKKSLTKAWKESVRTGLRNQVLPDVHDYLDVHRNIDGIASRIATAVAEGRYRPAAPEFILLEKKDGVSRRMAIPDPYDAITLQAIIDSLEKDVKAAQPCQSAFYSRSHVPPDPQRIDGTFAYPWWQLWPEFQQRIWSFSDKHPYVVIADIANYYDAIPLNPLRNCIASLSKMNENVLNLVFFLIEAMAWRPFYLPHPHVGLPQLNFDAARLLAHAYLFKLDREVSALTKGQFVRWMDDFDAGVESIAHGKRVLACVQHVLNSQGLQLNAGKCKILPGKEALAHFCAHHNRAVTIIENSFASGAKTRAVMKEERKVLLRSYIRFKCSSRVGMWDKVQMRYFRLFGCLRYSYAMRDVPEMLRSTPSVRGAVFRYLAQLGYNKRRWEVLDEFLRSDHCNDDASLLSGVRCMVDWITPGAGYVVQNAVKLATDIMTLKPQNKVYVFGSAVLLLAKYGSSQELQQLVLANRSIWERSPWAARQVAGVSPRLSSDGRNQVLSGLQHGGLGQGLQVLASLSNIAGVTTLDNQLRKYLFHSPNSGANVPLSKVMIVLHLFRGKLASPDRQALEKHMLGILSDGRYRRLVQDAVR